MRGTSPPVISSSDSPRSPRYRALICITTCQRLPFLRRQLPHFASFCLADDRFELLVSLDGDEPATREFCTEWNVPLLYSERREGVGLAKNRVLQTFPDFDYYFFLEDDVELIDDSVFPAHVDMHLESGIHHFSLFVRSGIRKPIGDTVIAGQRVVHCLYGGADFNFFTGAGLKQVGGWHPCFAKYRRWGHTEHSYRFFRAGLAPAPFNVAQDLARAFAWHVPPAVTHVAGVDLDENQIAAPERELLDQKLGFVPVQTISRFTVERAPPGNLRRLASVLGSGERYPLADRAERRQAKSDLHLWARENSRSSARSALSLIAAAWDWPNNPAIRHIVKTALRR
jgi:hypothetical protein